MNEKDPSTKTLAMFAISAGQLPVIVISASAIPTHSWAGIIMVASGLVALGGLALGVASMKKDRA